MDKVEGDKAGAPARAEERSVPEQEKDFKLACRRYARMRARTGK